MSRADKPMTASIEGGEEVGAATIAKVLGLTNARVNSLVSDGILHPVGKPRRYKLDKTVQEYLEYKISSQKSGDDKGTEARKLKADADYKAAKAAQEELELAELEGNMHRSEDVEAAFEQLAYNMRNEILALPGRLAIDVVAAETPAEAADLIQEQVNAVLQSLSEFEYDPAFYAERVRERKGWTDAEQQDGATKG